MKIESFKHIKETNKIEVVFRKPSNFMQASNPPRPVPDKVWKEIYSVEDGVITKTQTIKGTHTPSSYVNEKISFELVCNGVMNTGRSTCIKCGAKSGSACEQTD